MKAEIITIGDEILIGQIIDTNSTWLSQQLTSLGIDVLKTSSISDDPDAINKALDLSLTEADLVLLTGGLGPTKDDLTKKTLADYFGHSMYFDQDLFFKISSYLKKLGLPVTELIRQQCFMPSDIELLENKMGTAPGMLFKKENKWIVSMPGVPYEMKWIFEHSLLELLKQQYPEYGNIYYRTIHTVGMGETRIAEKIDDILEEMPESISMAYLPSLGQVRLRLTTKGDKSLFELVDSYVEKISARLGGLIFGFDDVKLEAVLQKSYSDKGLSLATAESCTGGFLANKIVSVSGASNYYIGSVISYDNRVKTDVLNVKQEILDQHGAVSEETVLAMLKGLLELTRADVGISISGIAGPGGGTVEKPVGTIWLAWGTKSNMKTRKLQLSKDRQKNIEYTTVVAMNSLRMLLTEL